MNEILRPLAFKHHFYLLNSLESLFKRVGSSQPAIDARLFTSVMMQVEHQGLTQVEPLDIAPLRSQIHRQIGGMFYSLR